MVAAVADSACSVLVVEERMARQMVVMMAAVKAVGSAAGLAVDSGEGLAAAVDSVVADLPSA
jgi:hypothetical protein